jgi:uncharacterized protein YdeI (YjbR/CyaY-like superfamily)
MTELPKNSIHPKTHQELRDWLMKNHTKPAGLWLITYKLASGKKRIAYSDIVDELLCFGWIDSKPNSLDEERSMLWIAPRQLTSGWSKINKTKVERLIKEKRMDQSGLDKINKAIANGTWSKLDQVENLEIPLDLEQEMKQYKSAQSNFDAFPRSVKISILEWITSAKREDTRLKRIAETAKLAEDNIRANQWRQSTK